MAKYIKNKELFEEVVRCKQTGHISNMLAQAFIQISHRYATKPNFSGYTYRDEMESDAILVLCENWQKFDPERTQNPFAYYTQIIHNSFMQTLNREKRQRNIRDKVLIYEGHNPSWSYEDEEQNNNRRNNKEQLQPDEPEAEER